MTHNDVRAALVSDEPVPTEARAHLAGCDACLAFARGLERVRRAAPLLVPAGPPAGLADRVVAEVEALPRAPVVPVRPSFGRRALARVAVGVAATVVVAAAAVALRPDPSPRVELAAAARRTADARTAKVRLEGTTTFVLPVADERTAPEFESVPDTLRVEVERQWRSLMAGFRRAMEAYERQLEEALGRIDDALEGVLPTSLPRPPVPRLPRLPTPSPPALPPSITTTVSVRASGDVSFTDRLRLTGAVGVDAEVAFDIVAGTDGVAVRAEGTPWAAAEARVGPWGVVVGGPDELLRALGGATDVTRTDDGRRYRFRIRSLDGTELTGEADVDADGRLSAVRLTASGRTGGLAGATWTTDLRVAFSEAGTPVTSVDVGDVRVRVGRPDDASRVIYPLGPGVRVAVD